MLKDLIRSQEKRSYVIGLLEEATLIAGKKDSYKRRRDCFHPSEIGEDFCPRSWLLGQQDKELYYKNSAGVQLQWVFDVGSSLHELVQERLAETGRLFGVWECKRWCMVKRCHAYGFKPEESMCPMATPHKEKWLYKEVAVDNDELNLHGKTDGILDLDEGKFIFEFKTMNSRMFATLAEPMEKHVEQAAWYRDTLEQENSKIEAELLRMKAEGWDVERALRTVRKPFKGTIIVYMNKDTQAFREFVIRADAKIELPSAIKIHGMEETLEDALADKKELLKQTLVWLEQGHMPERLEVCTSKSCTRARNCFAKDACFMKEEK